MELPDILIGVVLFVLGAAMGSFGCCQVWRLRMESMKGKKRSECMSCHRVLKWYELIPVVSWFAQKGKCRDCGEPIGWQEILCELGMGLLFVMSYFIWPERMGVLDGESIWSYAAFGAFLAMLVGMMVCFVYDMRWLRLPMMPLTISLACAILMVLLARVGGFLGDLNLWSFVWGLALLPGLYLLLYKASREKWVGGGDWMLALVCAVALSDWVLCLLCLLVSNLFGCVLAMPLMMRQKEGRLRLALGPLLTIGFVVVFFWGDAIRALLGI